MSRRSTRNASFRTRCALATGMLMLIALGGLGSGAAAAPASGTDLKVSISSSAGTVSVGGTLTYTIGVENLGPENATGVTLTDPLPKGADYSSADTTHGSCALQGRKVVCSLGTLEGGPAAKTSSATVTLRVIPRSSGTITNTVTVKGDQKDPVASNDSAAVTTTVSAATPGASCRGVRATIVGTSGPDTLTGTGGRDVIAALGGSDTIASLGGNDLICANGGNDTVRSGAGADRVFGGAGKDRLIGGAGRDLLAGNAGADFLKGGTGADRLRGGPGNDRCQPGPGRDSVRGCER